MGDDTRYAYLPGTSMAAPQVAGVAALMRHLNPDLPPADIVRILKQTAQATRGRRVDARAGLGHPRRRLGAGGRARRSTPTRRPRSCSARRSAAARSCCAGAGRTTRSRASWPPASPAIELWRSTPGRKARKIATTRAHSKRAARQARLAVPLLHDRRRQRGQPRAAAGQGRRERPRRPAITPGRVGTDLGGYAGEPTRDAPLLAPAVAAGAWRRRASASSSASDASMPSPMRSRSGSAS